MGMVEDNDFKRKHEMKMRLKSCWLHLTSWILVELQVAACSAIMAGGMIRTKPALLSDICVKRLQRGVTGCQPTSL